MDDLISRQALKQALGINADDCDKCAWGHHGRCKRGSDFEDACCAIEDAPSAEPEIIRCADCIHWTRMYGDDRWGVGDCNFFEKKLVMCKGYCAWAQRRTDE